MAIDGEKFLAWCESRFGHCLIKGNEVRINSPFVDPADPDTHHHCWCRVDGSTKKGEEREYGIYHCFKTDKRGSLPGLVMMVDGVEFPEALEVLGVDAVGAKEIDLKLQQFFDELYGNRRAYAETTTPEPVENPKMALPPSTWRITELATRDRWRVTAETYLKSRKLPIEKYFVCTAGRYRDRVIIPYYDADGQLIYWNGRFLGASEKVPKYQGPDYEPYKVGKDDVLYMSEWPRPGEKVHLTEGEFDADSIYFAAKSIGERMFGGAFGRKTMSERQVEMLRPYTPVIAVDADRWGKKALADICQDLYQKGIFPHYVCPPPQFKDWNKMLEKTSPKVVVRYIQHNERPLSPADLLGLLV